MPSSTLCVKNILSPSCLNKVKLESVSEVGRLEKEVKTFL